MNIRLTLEYDGTGYAGWQRQDNAMTVQQRVEEAIAAVTGERAGIVAAGRTDAGVHALGQVCHFHTGCTIPPGRIAFALNAHLPPISASPNRGRFPTHSMPGTTRGQALPVRCSSGPSLRRWSAAGYGTSP